MGLRVGIIGYGGIARAHLPGWQALGPRAQVVAAADVAPENLRAFKEAVPDGRVFKDYKKMLATARLDAVDICLPHHLHAEAILAACARKVHWLCEKPLCMNLDEAQAIDQAVQRSGVVAMSAHNQVFMPCTFEARRWVANGWLGKIYAIISEDCFIMGMERPGSQPGLAPPSLIAPGTWRAKRETMGGGELIDTGYHPTYRLLYVAGAEPVAVKAVTGKYRNPHMDGEDTATVLVAFENGVTGTIRTSWAMSVPAGHHQIHVIGERGEVYGSGGTVYFKPALWTEPAKLCLECPNTFSAEIAHFVESIETGRPPVQTHEDGIRVLKVILEAYRNA